MVALRRAAHGFGRDLRFGARLLRQSPWFALVSVLSLGLGLGTGVGIFGVMNAIVFRPLPGRNTDDIQAIYTSGRQGNRYGASSFADFQSFASVPDLFAGVCAIADMRANLAISGAVHPVQGGLVSEGCFETLDLQPHRGRLLRSVDAGRADIPPGIVLGYGFWRRVFHGDDAAIGQTVMLSGVPVVILGVADPGFAGFHFEQGADLWAPPQLAPVLVGPRALSARSFRAYLIYARLAHGVSPSQAEAMLAAVATRLRAEDSNAWTDASGATRRVTVADERASRFITGQGAVAAMMLGMVGAIAVVVLMACVNLATMSLARGVGRTQEINIRLALGASRARLLRQLATESLLISCGAILVGLGVVAAALRVFAAYRIPELPAFNLAIDGRVVAFAIALALAAPVLFGVAPGAHVLRLAIAEGLKDRRSLLRRRRLGIGTRELLIVVQVAASFALLIAASLFAGSVIADAPALRPRTAGPVAVVPIDFNNAAQSDDEIYRLTARLLDAAARLPDVDRATAASIVPLTGSYVGFRVGTEPDRRDEVVDGNLVAPGYFDVVGILLRAGRTFDNRDHARAPQVAIVSESLARRLWGAPEAVGRHLHLEHGPAEVVGVVADVPYRSVAGEPQPVMYLPLAQSSLADSSLATRFVLHARVRNAGGAVGTLHRALRDVDPRIVLGRATTLDQMLDDTKTPARTTQWIGGLAGLLQLGLALMATWGLVAYAVERRTAEIAIRRALGASEGAIVRLLMRPGLGLLAPAAILGCGAGVLGAQMLHANFIGLAPIDLRIMLPAILVLAAVVVVATWWPARRALMVAPASALKQS